MYVHGKAAQGGVGSDMCLLLLLAVAVAASISISCALRYAMDGRLTAVCAVLLPAFYVPSMIMSSRMRAYKLCI